MHWMLFKIHELKVKRLIRKTNIKNWNTGRRSLSNKREGLSVVVAVASLPLEFLIVAIAETNSIKKLKYF